MSGTTDIPVTVLVGAVLTGGASRRFGSDKALAVLSAERRDNSDAPDASETMGSRIVDELRRAGADPVVAVGGSAGKSLGIPIIADKEPGLGPLAGLATVLQWAGRGLVLVLPCDVPLLTVDHLRPLIEASTSRDPYQAAIAVVEGVPQPTVACWPAAAGHVLQRAVSRGERKMRKTLELVEWVGVPLPPEALADADDPITLRELVRAHSTKPPNAQDPSAESR